MKISVVLSTYERARDLALVLAGYALQDDPDFEVVVADDGSGPETATAIAEAVHAGLPVTHVWHPDRGFRKTESLDRAILRSTGDYLVFSDGDCIPRPDFVGTHRRLAAPRRFLSGGYVRLPPALSAGLTAQDVRTGWVWSGRALRRRGVARGAAVLRLLPAGMVATALDRITPTRASWNGMNASTWREAVVAVNGFDLDLEYGGLDREFGQRLENLGYRGLQVRHRAVLLHLHHERPYRDRAVAARQRDLREVVRSTGRTRAPRGIGELPEVSTTPPWEHGEAWSAPEGAQAPERTEAPNRRDG
jgi:glycosyltransferase involved in cell wall biosynthesis